ncbi:MAG: PilN domain-containing protein [Gemmatimonadota bacterium]
MIEINLHPAGETAKAKRRRRTGRRVTTGGGRGARNPWQTGMVAVLVVVPVAVAALWLTQRARANGLEERLQAASADSARLADLRALSDSLTERQTLIGERMDLIRTLDRDRFIWPHIMEETSRALPNFVWLTSIQELSPLPGLTVEIRGMAATPLAVTEYVRRLADSPYLGSVRILGSQLEPVPNSDVEVHAFTLIVDYDSPAEPTSALPADG